MKNTKKISVLISLVLITLLALGAVSAAEDTAVTDDADLAAVDDVQTVDDAPITDEIDYESNDIIVTDTGDSSDLDDADTDVISDTGLDNDSDDGDDAVVSDASSPKNALKAEPLRANGEEDLPFSDLFTEFNSGNTINLQHDYKWVTGNNRYYTLSKNIVINGNGHTIDGAGSASLFRVNGDYTITLNNVTIKNCIAQANGNNYYGGVISAQNRAITVNINNANFINNTAGTASNTRRGGVIYAGNGASIVVHNSTFINNSAYTGGIFYAGGSYNGNTPIDSYNSLYIGNNAVGQGAILYLYNNNYYYANATFNYNVFINNTAATGIIYSSSDSYLREYNFDYNWWGENHYNTSSVRVGNYLWLVEKYYVLKLKQTSATTIEVSLNTLFDGSAIPAGGVLPAREYLLTITGGGSEARITTPTGNFTGSASSNFTIAGNGTITAYVDNQVISLDIYQNTRGTIDLNVTIANVVLPNKAVAYVEASFDDTYNVTVGDKVYAVTVTNGHGQVTLDELPAGTYLAMLSHVDNDEFHDAYNLTTFNVTKAQSAISLTANTTSPTFGQEVKVTPSVTSADGTATITTGTIVYTVDGKNYASLEANQDLILTGLSAGEHRVVAKFGGNDGYEPSTSLELLINVQKAQITLSIVGAEVIYPESGKITLNSNVDGVYTIHIGEADYEVRVSLGSGTVAIPTMAVGNYTATVNVAESENYTAASATGTYNVTKADVKFTIDGDDRITYGETNVIVPTLTEGATGNIIYYIDNAETGTQVAYPDTFTTTVLNAGSHTIRAEYAGDDNYKGKNATFTFTVTQAEVDVTVTGATVVYPIHANVTVTASAAGTYTITVNGKEYDVEITEDGGSKLVTLDEIPVGVHYVAVNASATTNYKAVDIDKAATVVVNKPQLNLTVSSEEITYGGTANVKITLKDGETGLSMTGLIVSVGSTYYPVNIVDGQGTLPVSGLNVGTYNVIAVCSYSENYDVAIANGTITVKQATPAATVTVTVNPITYGGDAVINIGLDGVNSEKISGVVKVTVDNKDYDVVVTNGVGTLPVSGLATNAEGYTITATFAGNDNYGEATGTGSVVVNKADATVTVSADKETIKFGETATLSSVVTPGDDDGAVTYYVDGTAITGTTVSGLSVGEHTVVAKVAATDNYNEATSEALTITVEKADATITVSADETNLKYGESTTVSSVVSPSDDDGAVTYYVDGTAITGTTVSGLSVGTHTVVAKVAATDNYNAAESEALTITVAKADATIELTIDDNELTFGESTTVSSVVSPSDDDGAVTYYVDGTAITGTTVSGLSVGTHTVVAKVAATANYNAAESEAKTITISKATPEITITTNPVTFPTQATVVVNANVPGTYTIRVGNKDYAVVVGDTGSGSALIDVLNPGTYEIDLSADLGPNYNPVVQIPAGTLTVNPQVGPFVVESTGLGYATLAEALAKTNGSGDTITVVEAGTYSGEGNIGVTIAQDVAIKAAEGLDVVFNANGATDSILTIAEGKKVSIDGIDFTGANAAKGGAIYINKDAEVAISNADFTENTASTRGGAIYSEGTLTVSDCTFDKNDITTRNQNVDNGGAAIYNYGGTLTVKDSSFTNNLKDYVIRGTGGATGDLINGIIMSSGATTITGSEFINNSGCYGGAVAVLPVDGSTVSLTVDDCDFINNLAYCGAAIQLENCAADYAITNSRFENNTATGIGSPGYGAAGGAIDILGSSGKGTITNCIFSGNDAPDGAGINVQNGDITVDKCTFMENTGEYAAGLEGWNSKVVVTDSYFIDNAVTEEGAGIYIYGTSTLELTGSVFDGNTAPVNRNIHSRANPSTIERNIFDINDTTIEVNDIPYGQDEVINGTFDAGVNYDLTGSTVSLTINGAEVTATVTDGNKFTTTITKPDVGTYPVVFNKVTDSDSNVYVPENPVETSFTVEKVAVEVTVTADPVTFPTQATVVVNANVPGTYTIRVGNKDYAVVVGDTGSGSQVIDLLEPGTYEVILTADLGPNYDSVVQVPACSFTVAKATPIVEVNDTSAEWNTPVSIPVKVTDADGKPISGTVIVTVDWEVDGVTQVVELDENGEGTANFVINQALGDLTVTAKFIGNDNYTAAQDTAVLAITNSTDANIEAAADPVTFGEDSFIDVVVTDGRGAVLDVAKVNVTIDGETKELDVVDGKVNIGKLPVGDTPVTVSYVDENHKLATADVTVTVNPASGVQLEAVADNYTFGAGGKLNITVTDVDGNKLNGTVGIEVDGELLDPAAVVTDGFVSIDLAGHAVGEHTVYVTFYNESYLPADIITHFNVTKASPTVTITPTKDAYAYGEDVVLDVTVKDGETGLTGTVVVTINNVNYAVDVTDGTGQLTVKGLANNTYPVTAKFLGNDNYEGADAEAVSVVVNGTTDAVITATVSEPSVDGEATLSVNVVDGAGNPVTGKVNVTVGDGEAQEYDVTDGVASIPLSGLALGENTIVVSTNEYTADPVTLTAVVPPKNTADLTVGTDGENITIEAKDGTTPLNGTATVVIDGGEPITVPIDETGKAVIPMDDLAPGQHTVEVTFANDNYEPVSEVATITVPKGTATVTITPTKDAYAYGEDVVLDVTVKDGETGLTGTVVVTVGGSDYAVDVTDGTGQALIKGLADGSYDATAKFLSNDYYEEASATQAAGFVVNAKPVPTVSLTVDPVTIKETESATIKVSLVDGDTNIDGLVIVTIDGTDYAVNVVAGEGSVTVKNLAPGTYTIAGEFIGNDDYAAAIAEDQTLEVTKVAKVSMNVTSAGENLVIKLTDEDNNPVTGKVNVTIDGTTKEVTVNDGVATVPLGAGNHNVTVVYPGDDIHTGTQVVDNIVYIKKSADQKIKTKIIVNKNQTITYNKTIDNKKDYYVYATLVDSKGNILVNKTVTFFAHKKLYVTKTNSKGQFRFSIAHVGYGECTHALTFIGDDDYEASFAVACVSIKKQKVKLTSKARTFKATKKVKKLTATLKNSKGKALAGKKITFIVNGKKYTAKTNKKGVATVKVKVTKKKTYKVKVKFAGDKTYAKKTISRKLKIT